MQTLTIALDILWRRLQMYARSDASQDTSFHFKLGTRISLQSSSCLVLLGSLGPQFWKSVINIEQTTGGEEDKKKDQKWSWYSFSFSCMLKFVQQELSNNSFIFVIRPGETKNYTKRQNVDCKVIFFQFLSKVKRNYNFCKLWNDAMYIFESRANSFNSIVWGRGDGGKEKERETRLRAWHKTYRNATNNGMSFGSTIIPHKFLLFNAIVESEETGWETFFGHQRINVRQLFLGENVQEIAPATKTILTSVNPRLLLVEVTITESCIAVPAAATAQIICDWRHRVE